MIDSHCHLTYEALSSLLAAVLLRAKAAGVTRLITIGTSIDDARKAITLCEAHPQVRCAIGIHPHHAASATPQDFGELRTLQERPAVLALGEMGLDYHYEFAHRDVQKRVFVEQLQLARDLSRPIVIHCREAVDDCLAILGDFPEVPADFHCFTGSASEARRILDLGYYIGFTGIVTYKRSDELREVARFAPADRFLVETDAPYLAPEPHRKLRVNEPSLVIHTADAVAQARGLSRDEVDRLTTQNVERLFGWT